MTEATRAAVERAARLSYGRLVAFLAARAGDVAAAEDAVAEAFVKALEAWPRTGVPAKPEAWLATAARRTLLDAARRRRVRDAAWPALRRAVTAARVAPAVPDERLALLMLCAHPALDPADRTPLMLQVALGLDAARIASAFLVAPAAMGQRLVRAKAKLRAAGATFEPPEPADLPGRLASVLDAVYAAYGSGWDDVAGSDPRRRGLAEEAVLLGRLVAELAPDEPEAHGLLALMLHGEARRPARRDAAGRYVPLAEQDPAAWSGDSIAEAEAALERAAAFGRVGRFQLEAAIQSAHAARRRIGTTPWADVAALYGALVRLTPTAGALVGHAAALAEADGAAAGLAALDRLDAGALRDYQPAWALRAHLLRRLGDAGADAAYARAIGLCEDPAVRAFLDGRTEGTVKSGAGA